MLYYVLLAPAAAVSNADPTAVTASIALGGVAAVGVTAWLARSISGPLAGIVAGILMAVSASAVDESTFIWNPNLIALTSSVALAAAWQAWRSGQPGWWVVAGAAAVTTMHCHVLGVILSPVIAALLVADVVRRRAADDRRGARGVLLAALAWLVLLLLSYVPLLIHELASDFSETRAAVAFLTDAGGPAAVALPARLAIVWLRVLGWPLIGLITDAPLETLIAAVLVVALAAWRGWGRGTTPRGDERPAVRWLAVGLLWTVVALAVGASSLATVVIGLPNDHYHAFADPIVFVLVGAGIAALVTGRRRGAGERVSFGAAAAAVLVVALVGWNLTRQPPPVATDGGWPAAEAAAARVLVAGGNQPVSLVSLPTVKPPDALRFPLERLQPDIVIAELPIGTGSHVDTTARVVLCDELFHETIGADCAGPAEDSAFANVIGQPVPRTFLLDRFEAAPGRWISIYRPTTLR
jgi:hypothetical protein